MNAVESLQAAIDQVSQSQAKVIASFGGQVPAELSEQFQMIQDRMAGQMGWVKDLSDRAEEAKAKAEAKLAAAAKGPQVDTDLGIDFEAYPWQFRDEHQPERDKTRQLLDSLRDNQEKKATFTN